MITKNELKYYSSLLQKKFRNEEKKFIIEGTKSVLEGINSSAKPEVVFITHEYNEANPDLADYLSQDFPLKIIRNQDFNKLTDTVNPQGICAVFPKPERIFSAGKLHLSLIVILDGIADPGNCGTIIRLCDWFGISYLLLTENCADVYNPKTLRATMGSVFHIKIFENLKPEVIIPDLQKIGFSVYLTDTSGEDIYSIELNEKAVMVFSNEAHGPSEYLRNNYDVRVTIPGSGQAESLNVASSAAIVLSEMFRRNISH